MKNEIQMFQQAQTNPVIREKFLMKKQSLVKKICYRFCGRVDEDLVQEGNIGLMLAFDKFDPERGFKFDTYAQQWVFSYMQQWNWKNRVVRMGKRLRAKRIQSGGESYIPVLSLEGFDEDCMEFLSADLPPDEALERNEDIQFVQNFVRDIPSDRNREMILQYYGLNDFEAKNMVLLSGQFGVTKQRCQQIISQHAQKMMREYKNLTLET
tara:strand:- start:240 stop:869 length:630 start_codon:yes stop_codon:yes gene_type:complete